MYRAFITVIVGSWMLAAALVVSAATMPPMPGDPPGPPPLKEGVDYRNGKINTALADTEGWLKQHPKDARAYYALGRLHALAWAHGDPAWTYGDDVAMSVPAKEGGVAEPMGNGIFDAWRSTDISKHAWSAQDIGHITAAIEAYRTSVALDPSSPQCCFGAGKMIEEALVMPRILPGAHGEVPAAERQKFAAAVARLSDAQFSVRTAASKDLATAMPNDIDLLLEVKPEDAEAYGRVTEILTTYWNLETLKYFRMSYALAAPEELKQTIFSEPDRPISLVAGRYILNILGQYPDAAKAGEKQEVTAAVEKLQRIPNPTAPRT